MNEIQTIVTGWHPLVVTGVVLSCLWAGAYIFSWLIQWSWAWVDESEVGKNNWLASKVDWYSRLPYEDGWYKVNDYYTYHRYASGRLLEWSDYPPNGYRYDSDVPRIPDGYIKLGREGYTQVNNKYFFILPAIWFTMFSLWVWYISMWVVMAVALAYTMRMARRGQKLLTKHINDKDAHK